MDRHQAAVERQLKKPATAAAAATINNPYLAHAATAGSARSALRADPGFRHIPKTFRFAQQGKYIEEAEQMRKQMELERLREEIAQKVKRAGLDSELDLVGDQAVRHEAPPEVEWWDLQFLPGRTYADVEPGGAFHQLLQAGDEDDAAVITNLIQHPVPIEPLRNPAAKAAEARPLMLTKREQKKMRRLRRMEVLNEKQEKIRLGLLPPDQPKLNLSNLMRVMGTEAVADPTTMEKVVRTQMKQRAEEHLRRNAEQQLTAEEKSEKKQQKLTEDITNRTHVAVFKYVLIMCHINYIN
jgi:U4/U6 small nuclear ribonucleoprotein PRP3